MQTMIDTRVPICRVPGCSGALDKGFMNHPGEYQGTYFFCVNCGMRYKIVGQGQAENELLCEYDKEEKMDNVNHPKHYNIPGRKECIEEMLDIYGKDAVKTFCTLNAYKYRYRHELKGGEEDLKKAKWYEEYALKLREGTTL